MKNRNDGNHSVLSFSVRLSYITRFVSRIINRLATRIPSRANRVLSKCESKTVEPMGINEGISSALNTQT